MITLKELFKVGKSHFAVGIISKERKVNKNCNKTSLMRIPTQDPPCSFAEKYIGLTEKEIREMHPDAEIKNIPSDYNIYIEIHLSNEVISCIIDKSDGLCLSADIF